MQIREQRVAVRCECGEPLWISTRAHSRHRMLGTRWRCRFCRRNSPAPDTSPRYRNYWLDRYSLEWIKETAEMIWG